MKIGFIGLGRMGFSLARSLLKNQSQVVVHDTNAEVTRQLEAQGAVVAHDVASLCRQVDMVFTMLPGPGRPRHHRPPQARRGLHRHEHH